MADIRSQTLPQDVTGKLIYQLTSASALKDTDLFPISSTDNLTRSVSLGQIKASFNNNYYNKDNIDLLLDELRQQIKNSSDNIFDFNNDITEFRNEFINKLNQLENTLRQEINNIDKKLTDITDDIDVRITDEVNQINATINNLNESLTQKINNLDIELNKKIDSLILFGVSVPSTLPTGRVFLQYF